MAMKRRPVKNRAKDRRKFTATAERTNAKNVRTTISRGGIRL